MIGDRWGVTDAETRLRFGCDDVVASPALEVWRGVTVGAPAEQVWPWVVQVQLAPYSYDWLDNLGRRSPQRLLGHPEPRPGQPFTSAAAGPTGEVLAVEPGRQYTGRVLGAVMSYLLVPDDDDPARTRLLLKVVVAGWRVAAPLISVGDLVMARRQLLNLKRLAESTGQGEGSQGEGS